MTNNINIKEIWQEVLGRAEYGSKFIQFIPSNDIQELPKMKLYLSHDKTNLPALEVNLGPTGRGDLVPKKYQGFEVAVERLQWGIDPPSESP